MKKIAVWDLGEFWYGDYKEPFEQLEGGVPGHPIGVVLKADDGNLLCAFCGKTWANLAAHAKAHGMRAGEYKEAVGLLAKTALKSESLRLGSARTAQQFGFGAYPEHRGDPSSRIVQRAMGDRHGSAKPEFLNKTGTCYAQALAVGRTVVRETGRLSQKTLSKHGIFDGTVRRYFGDMDGFRRAIGVSPLHRRQHISDAELLQALRSLALDLGRTPINSDIRRYGLPGRTTYIKRFGSWTAARQRAGLVVAVPVSKRDDIEALVFEAYATFGTVAKTAAHLHIDRAVVTRIFSRYGAPFTELRSTGPDTTIRREWAADMARRLAGTEVAA